MTTRNYSRPEIFCGRARQTNGFVRTDATSTDGHRAVSGTRGPVEIDGDAVREER